MVSSRIGNSLLEAWGCYSSLQMNVSKSVQSNSITIESIHTCRKGNRSHRRRNNELRTYIIEVRIAIPVYIEVLFIF